MNDEDPVDLSPLRAGDDGGRWEATVRTTLLRVDRVLAERARGEDVLALIARWRRPVLAAAAVLIALLVPVEWVLERREAEEAPVRALAQLSTRVLHGEIRPSGAVLRAIMSREELR